MGVQWKWNGTDVVCVMGGAPCVIRNKEKLERKSMISDSGHWYVLDVPCEG